MTQRQQHQAMQKATSWDAQRRCGKVGFPSKRAAEGRGRVLGYAAYKCKTCKRWHLSSSGS